MLHPRERERLLALVKLGKLTSLGKTPVTGLTGVTKAEPTSRKKRPFCGTAYIL